MNNKKYKMVKTKQEAKGTLWMLNGTECLIKNPNHNKIEKDVNPIF